MQLSFDLRREDDGRWWGEVVDLPGTRASGATPEEAAARAKGRALRVLADRLSNGEVESFQVMEIKFVSSDVAPRGLSEYFEAAMAEAVIERLDDGSFAGRVPPCPGVVVFAGGPTECRDELRSALEDWVVAGLKLRHELPVIGGIRLHERAESTKPVGAL